MWLNSGKIEAVKQLKKSKKSQQRAVPKQRKSTNPHSDGIKSNRNPKRKS